MKYYLIYNTNNRVIAIHKTPESANLCFKRLTELDDTPHFIYLSEVEADEFGNVIRHETLATYSRGSGLTIHTDDP